MKLAVGGDQRIRDGAFETVLNRYPLAVDHHQRGALDGDLVSRPCEPCTPSTSPVASPVCTASMALPKWRLIFFIRSSLTCSVTVGRCLMTARPPVCESSRSFSSPISTSIGCTPLRGESSLASCCASRSAISSFFSLRNDSGISRWSASRPPLASMSLAACSRKCRIRPQ